MATLINTITVSGVPSVTDTAVYTNATCAQANTAEVFEAKLDAADGRWFIEIDNTGNANNITVSNLAGGYVGASTSEAGVVNAGSKAVVYADSAACKSFDGKIQLKLTPASGTLASGGVKLHAVQFIPAECK